MSLVLVVLISCVWCNVFSFSCVDILCLVLMSLVLVVLISCVWCNVFSFSVC